MKIQGKTILVTGGGSGIGRALVLNLLSRGANVAAVDVHDATIQETKQLAGPFSKNLSIHVVNITDSHAVAQLPQKIIETHGSIDGIINNAGIIQPFQKVNDLSMESIQKVMDVNFYGMLYVTKSFLPHLLERPDAHIVNISSMGGFLPVPGQTVYGASKAAVKLFTEGLHSELLETSVRITVVFPGAVQTNITQNSGLEIPAQSSNDSKKFKMLSPDVAAQKIVSAMEQNKYRVCVGSDSRMMDLLVRIAPEFAAGFIARKMASLLNP
jgi:short-subunit dehydrogenase